MHVALGSRLLILAPDSWLLDSAVCKTAPPARRFFIRCREKRNFCGIC